LTSKGLQERDLAVAGLVAWRPDRIFSSPLERCLSIAKPAALELGITVEVDQRVAEMCFGVLEGLTHQEAQEAGIPFPWGSTAAEWPAPGGESLDGFSARLSQACDCYASFPGRTAVISHGGAVRGMFAYWMHIPADHLWSMDIANVASTVVAFRDGIPVLRGFGLTPEEIASR
jgi:alpha-ribazole phosphatase